jgi:hypothetical protein
MNPIGPAMQALGSRVADLTARFGRRVEITDLGVTDRAGVLPLQRPGLSSPNRACRLFRAADGWMALNLARDEDRDLVPAWLGCEFGRDPWEVVARHAADHSCADLQANAALLGLPAAIVGEVIRDTPTASLQKLGASGATQREGPLKVVDLSALWAGPMCGAILAAMGARVTKVESIRRPDPTRTSTPEFFRRLNGAKSELSLDLTATGGQAKLSELVSSADVLITSARPRAFASLGLGIQAVFAANPSLVWVAVTGYGWTGDAAQRVAFGDDAAAAGGLVRWTRGGEPRFLGDALADPVTGLAAAEGALRGLAEGGGVLIDVSLAGSAAGAAAISGLRRPA